MKDVVNKLYGLFDKREKRKLGLILVMMLLAAFFEVLGIGLIVPFISVATKPNLIQDNSVLSYLYETLQFTSTTAFLICSVVLLLAVFVIKNVYILWYQHRQYKVILDQQVKLSQNLFRTYLTKPYIFHLQRNTAVLLRNINVEVPKVFQGVILSALQLIAEIVVMICIFSLLLAIEPIATLIVSGLMAACVALFFALFNKKIGNRGREQQNINREMIKWTNQGLGASKEVKVSGKEHFFVEAYRKHSVRNANNTRYMKVLDHVPRLYIETLLVTLVLVMLLVIMLQDTGVEGMMSTMALFSLAAFRLMPSINRIVSLVTTIKYNIPAFSVVYEDLSVVSGRASRKRGSGRQTPAPASSYRVEPLKRSIELSGVSFRYPEQAEAALTGISLSIPAGKSAAIIGESGSGKSTLVDIMLGLLEPEQGRVIVDGVSLNYRMDEWRSQIGYIPQFIYLTDDTIRANVAFGVDENEIDDAKVWHCLEQAQLKSYVASLPDALETEVGERGVRLSGGQRQRIGIARALYHNPSVLFMDEATSALDNETEQEVMNAVEALKGDKTIIIIAHRLSTIAGCDIVYVMNKGKLVDVQIKSEKAEEQPPRPLAVAGSPS